MTDIAAFAGTPHVPAPQNDSNRAYLPGSPERAALKARLKQMAGDRADIPLIIGGAEVRTGNVRQVVMPHSHREVLAEFHLAGAQELKAAAEAALQAKAVDIVTAFAGELGLTVLGCVPSALKGPKGNQEYLLYLQKA